MAFSHNRQLGGVCARLPGLRHRRRDCLDGSAASASFISAVGVDVIFAGARKGFRYAVEASTDLRAWTSVFTSGPLDFNPTGEFHGAWRDVDAGRFRQRWYRGW
jgi:hypothetical protein